MTTTGSHSPGIPIGPQFRISPNGKTRLQVRSAIKHDLKQDESGNFEARYGPWEDITLRDVEVDIKTQGRIPVSNGTWKSVEVTLNFYLHNMTDTETGETFYGTEHALY